jgi:hypothetical protein
MIPDDPVRTAGPGELWSDIEDDSDLDLEPGELEQLQPIAAPLQPAPYTGADLGLADWLTVNGALLRDRWRAHCDILLRAGEDVLDERGYQGWCVVQYELQRTWPGA